MTTGSDEWDGRGHPPGYLMWAWKRASPSLLRVAQHLQDRQDSDDLVMAAFASSGRRALISAKAVIIVAKRWRR